LMLLLLRWCLRPRIQIMLLRVPLCFLLLLELQEQLHSSSRHDARTDTPAPMSGPLWIHTRDQRPRPQHMACTQQRLFLCGSQAYKINTSSVVYQIFKPSTSLGLSNNLIPSRPLPIKPLLMTLPWSSLMFDSSNARPMRDP
jgi:hypothetical protein